MSLMVLEHFLLVTCILCTKLLLSEAATLGNETDRLALLAFRDQVTGDPLSALTSWNDSLHFCEWHGVRCSRQHQRITVLNLQGKKLMGSLSPSIGNLSFLRVIELSNNSFYGEIPQEIDRLFRLQYLNLSANALGGEIPANISNCLRLELLNFNQNRLVGRIPLTLGLLSKLERLHITANDLTGIIPPSLTNITSLEFLSLARNNLEGSIPADFGRLANLKVLQISQNKLSGMIPSSIYNLSSITFFSVAANQLYGSLPSNLGSSFPNLEELYVGTNQFTGSIPVSISNASRLKELYFTNNTFSGPVPENLGTLSGLVKINLGRNHLGGTSNDLNFLTSMINCTRLELLGIHVNNFKGVLPHRITNLSTHLQILTTGANGISGTIPPGIENLRNLNMLGFESNLITGLIPVGIGKLQKLEFLALLGNSFSGQIPSSFGNLTSLNRLHLAANDLTGSIPSSLGNCQQLQILQLSRNNLNGTIPREIMNLPSLSIALTLAHNSLEGSLPPEVGNLKNLGRLDVSENKLSGEIPQMLGNCLSLIYLNLKGNSFKGNIPQQLSNLRGIQALDLSRNNLSGQIPEYLETFPFLEKLNLSFNNLEGEVPKRGVFTNGSAISILGNTNLCGGIPQLQLPICRVEDSTEKEGSAHLQVIIPVISVALFLILLAGFATLYWKRKPRKEVSSTVSLEGHLNLSYKDILKSTNGFSSANLIGEGSYGSVYKGILDRDNVVVAVKVLNIQQWGVTESFMAECKALSNTRHRNLIKILTSCSSLDYKGNDFKALVLEFMPKGNLEEWLHPKAYKQQEFRNLNLKQRLTIAHEVASALDYLHHDCQRPIVHCDLKPSNVLLDDEMCAHVSDFGLARFLPEISSSASRSQTSFIGLKGTIGYVAPEYGINGRVSTHCDIYSYGILVLEMFTGKRPTDDLFKDGLSLHDYAKTAFPDRVMEIVDPTLLSEEETVKYADNGEIYDKKNIIVEECLVNLIGIGLRCSAANPSARMNMTDVVRKMDVIKDMFSETFVPKKEKCNPTS